MTKYLFKTVTSLAGGENYIHQYQSVNKVLTQFSILVLKIGAHYLNSSEILRVKKRAVLRHSGEKGKQMQI